MWIYLAVFGAGAFCGILLVLALALVMQSSRISAAEDRRAIAHDLGRIERELWALRQNHVNDVAEDDEEA